MNIEWARYCETPDFAKGPPPKNRLYRKGLAYEAKVKEALRELYPQILLGPWIEYKCRGNTAGICQPDAVIPGHCVIEVKLSYRKAAEGKLALLYTPLVSFIEQRPHHYVQVTRRLTRGFDWPLTPIDELLEPKQPGFYHVVHHI